MARPERVRAQTRFIGAAIVAIFCMLVLLGQKLMAQDATIIAAGNTATRTQWVEVAVPFDDIPRDAKRGVFAPHGWHVALGRSVGTHSRMVSVAAVNLKPGVRIDGTFEWKTQGDGPPYGESDWVSDAPDKVVPRAFVVMDDGRTLTSAQLTTTIVHADRALRVIRHQGRLIDRVTGAPSELFVRSYTYRYAGQDVVPFSTQLVHSDSTSKLMLTKVRRWTLQTGEFHVVRWAKRYARESVARWVPALGAWATNLMIDVDLADGVRPWFHGVLLCQPESGGIPPTSPRWLNLVAGYEGDTWGCVAAGEWDGRWLALQATPEIPIEARNAFDSVTAEWRGLVSSLTRRGDYFEQRPRSLLRNAGSTGDQAEFGLTKGSSVVSAGNPLGIELLLHSVTSQCRPTGYYDHDMSIVTVQSHPRWGTWSQNTHRLVNKDDSLGKEWQPGSGGGLTPTQNGYGGVDDQHCSFLNEQAAYALTGRFVLRDLMRERIEVRLAAFQDTSGRGLGRTLLTMANDHLLSGDARLEVYAMNVATRGGAQHRNIFNFHTMMSGPGKYWEVTLDPRALVDANGQPVAAVNVWQGGLFFPGVAAASNVWADERWRDAAYYATTGVIYLGWFNDMVGWRVVDYVKTTDGNLPPANWYANGGNVVGKTHSSHWFGDWSGTVLWPSLLTDDKLGEGPEVEIEAKRLQILASRSRPRTWRSAEWRAILVR